MSYTKINIAIATPTREMAYEYLKTILGDEYNPEKECSGTSVIYESNLLVVFFIEEFVVPIIPRGFQVIYCRPNALNSEWFDRYFAPLGTRGFGLIEEKKNKQGGKI